MKHFRKANIPDEISAIERERVDTNTSTIQQQVNESPDDIPANTAFEPNAQMAECIRKIQYTLLPVLTSGELSMTGETAALYTSLVRCITEFEHAFHAIVAIHSIKRHSEDYGMQDPQMFNIMIGQQLMTQDERRMESFKEMTYVLSEMSKLRSMQATELASYILRLVDKCEAAMGQDVSEYYLMG